jgi:hypothetical protein
MNLDIFKKDDPSGRMSKELYILKNHKEEYDYIINYCELNKIFDIPFKEKVYLCLNSLEKRPTCKNYNCDNLVKFRNSNIGYREYCSTKCISSDPNIKKSKELKSIEKWGTKTPAESNEIKNKIIDTNRKKYGSNSPMGSKEVQEKSKRKLLEKFGVDNASKSKEILEKRIESFKLSNYKETYKETSLKRYGVEHPWMNKEIHKKTIDVFYKDYKERIINKIDTNLYEFLSFEKNLSTELKFKCNKCSEEFKILPYQFYYRINNNLPICTKCFPISENSSISQIELFNFINENYNGLILQNDKNVIKPYEIDVYLPELNIGFEFNGVFWHSDKFKDDKYHYKKNKLSLENGVNLYTIWEDDWNTKKEICKSFILNKLKKSKVKIGARKTNIKEVSYLESKKFLDENHLQGDVKSSIRIGLYNNNELISIMTFSKLRLPLNRKLNNKTGVYELTRFCNKIENNVVGGASKLLNYFINKYNPVEIQTYSDNLISEGDLYRNLGFNYIHESEPGYWYVINGIREHRFNWRKQKLVEMGYDKEKTENEIMLELGFWRIYNAGNKKWILYN